MALRPFPAMPPLLRLTLVLLGSTLATHAAAPVALVAALERLRDQKSYSWEVINADPGPVVSEVETRRGTVTNVQQSMQPNMKGTIDRQGDTLIRREWSDGVKLDTVIAADGAMITNTPEGWMTDKEILSALAEERLRSQGVTPRFRWLRRADRPDVRRPDQELVPLLRAAGGVENNGDTYTARARIRPDGTVVTGADDGQPAIDVTLAMTLRGGVIRDYEMKMETTRAVSRARVQVPISDQRIVIITYLPVTRIDIPDDARAKLKAAKPPAPSRGSER